MILYELKVAYERQTGEDNPAKVKETYIVEGINCTDVEGRLLEEIKPFISGDCEVTSCRKVQYFDILDNTTGDKWYKGKIELITVEEDGKETRKSATLLIQAADLNQALKRLHEQVSHLDCELVSILRTPIMDVLRTVGE